MKKQDTTLNVAPPESYKAPSLPTLAALGLLSAAALVSGCSDDKHIAGGITAPKERPTEELTEGEIVAPRLGGEMPAEARLKPAPAEEKKSPPVPGGIRPPDEARLKPTPVEEKKSSIALGGFIVPVKPAE